MAALDTERVWRDFHDGLLGFVRRRVADPSDADDIVQRIFLQVHRALPSVRDTSRLHAWLYQAARRAIADFYREPRRRRELAAGSALDVADLAGPTDDRQDDRAAFRALARCLEPLVAVLSPADQQTLRIVDVEGLSQVEAARRLGLSISGMKSRVQRARGRLRAVVAACCQVDLDRRGTVVNYEPRLADGCACGTEPASRTERCR